MILFRYFRFLGVVLGIIFTYSETLSNPSSDETHLAVELSSDGEEMDMDSKDPLEYVNRGLFAFHSLLDGLLIKPAAYIYRDVLPEQVQDMTSNFFDNLSAPVTLANHLLQAEGARAAETFVRIMINTTIGIAGLFDVAAEGFGIHPHKTDFGITLRSYDIPSGPFLFIPLIGPSTFVDAIGRVVDYFIDPLNIWMIRHDYEGLTFVRAGAQGLITRAKLIPITEKIEKTPDSYAQYRIYYLQNRDSMVKGEEKTAVESAVPTDVIKSGTSTEKL